MTERLLEETQSEIKITDTSKVFELIDNSDVPDEIKQRFKDVIAILGRKIELKDRAKQIYDLSEELNLTKRHYLNERELESDPGINDLIFKIIHKYFEI